jgi:hypothetical protein
MKRIIIIVSCALFLLTLPFTAYAADNGDGVSITVVIPNTVKEPPKPAPTPKPPTNYLYPVSVLESQDNGRREIIKTYEIGAGEKPNDISRESFVREGWLYELSDITKKETSNADVREHTEKVSLNTATNEMADILQLLAPTMQYQSENGYIGVLQLDIASIKVETAGTKAETFTATATREYPNLSTNDSSLVPKTITDGGREYALQNIEWRTQNSTAVDYAQIPDSYTAAATYMRTGYRNVVTGYETTAEYKGSISKILKGKTVYTASFIGIPIVAAVTDKPEETMSTPAPEPTEEETEQPTEETPDEPETEPAVTESIIEAPTDPEIILQIEAAPTVEPSTEPTAKIEPETAEPGKEEKEAENETDKTNFNFLPVIIAAILGACIGGGFVFFYMQKEKNKGSSAI